MHCIVATVATVACMSQLLCIALLILLHACIGHELDIQSLQHIRSYGVTYAQAYVHYYIYALMLFICEVSCKLTCLVHLYVCMREGAVGCSHSVMQFSPYEWILLTRLTVWHPCFGLCIYTGRWQCINYSWFTVWNAEVQVVEYKLKPSRVTACRSFHWLYRPYAGVTYKMVATTD